MTMHPSEYIKRDTINETEQEIPHHNRHNNLQRGEVVRESFPEGGLSQKVAHHTDNRGPCRRHEVKLRSILLVCPWDLKAVGMKVIANVQVMIIQVIVSWIGNFDELRANTALTY